MLVVERSFRDTTGTPRLRLEFTATDSARYIILPFIEFCPTGNAWLPVAGFSLRTLTHPYFL
jgi:hypothetical protein